MKSPSLDVLKEYVVYDASTGLFRRTGVFHQQGRARAGDIAGAPDNKGYWRFSIKGVSYQCHRLAWLYVYGVMPDQDIDHINGNPADNRIENLRLADDSTNQANRKRPSTNTSGFKGVTWNAKSSKWQSGIKVNGKSTHLGLFSDPAEAHEAYLSAARSHFGKFARAA